MSAYIIPGIKVRIEQLEGKFSPRPLPLENGFTVDNIYEIIGLNCPSETADAYAILINDRDEFWFISTRHLRIVK